MTCSQEHTAAERAISCSEKRLVNGDTALECGGRAEDACCKSTGCDGHGENVPSANPIEYGSERKAFARARQREHKFSKQIFPRSSNARWRHTLDTLPAGPDCRDRLRKNIASVATTMTKVRMITTGQRESPLQKSPLSAKPPDPDGQHTTEGDRKVDEQYSLRPQIFDGTQNTVWQRKTEIASAAVPELI